MPPASIKARSASAGIPPCLSPLAPASPLARRPRRGFTLVELLVVIGIIAVLAAIITPAVMRAQASARNAAIKAEIDMLHMAIMNYKNEYGSFPPCIRYFPTPSDDLSVKHIQRLFPRCNASTEITLSANPANSLTGWLRGYSADPSHPVTGSNVQKLFDFDQSRTATLATGGSVYFPSGKPDSPYIYINSQVYGSGAWPSIQQQYQTNTQTYNISISSYAPQINPRTNQPFNPDSFQIICAGRDGVFSEDTNCNDLLDVGEDRNGNNTLDKSDDDLSNFWPGTRRDYQDSLNQ